MPAAPTEVLGFIILRFLSGSANLCVYRESLASMTLPYVELGMGKQ